MKGHARFICFHDLTDEILSQYDLKLHITRDIKQGMRRGFVHVPQLSPTTQLRNDAIYRWKKLKFTAKELEIIRNGESGTWFDLYKPRFEKEMETRKDFISAYNRLRFHLDNGVNVLLVCYCENPYKCHRSLIHYSLIRDGYESVLS